MAFILLKMEVVTCLLGWAQLAEKVLKEKIVYWYRNLELWKWDDKEGQGISGFP